MLEANSEVALIGEKEETTDGATDDTLFVDFSKPQLCERSTPILCTINDILVKGQNWARLLVSITEMFIKDNNPHILQLYNQSLFRKRSNKPFFLINKIQGLTCAQLTNGYWINVNYNIPTLVNMIGALCVHCGVDLTNVIIKYVPKNNEALIEGLPQSSYTNRDIKMIKVDESYQYKLNYIKDLIIKDYPNGFDFNAMSLRLIVDKVGFDIDETLQSYMKQQMFCRADKIWLYPDMISDEETRKEITANVEQWLEEYHCFSIAALYDIVFSRIREKCANIDDFEAFLLFLLKDSYSSNIKIVSWWNMFRVARIRNINCQTAFYQIAQKVNSIINNAGGMVIEEEVKAKIPALDDKLLDAVIKEYLPEVIKTDISGIDCLQNIDSLGLPEEFSESLWQIITHLDDLDIHVSDENLHTALSLFYDTNFNKEYKFTDKRTFRRLIALYYHGSISRSWSGGIFAKEID